MTWRGKTRAFADADRSWGITRFADRVWGLDAIFSPAEQRPVVRVVAGTGGDVVLPRGIFVIDGDLVADSFVWRAHAEGTVVVVTGTVTAKHVAVAGPANLWVDRLVAELVTTELTYAGSVIANTVSAPVWLHLGDGEVVIPKADPGRIIVPDDRLGARRFRRAEPASGALAVAPHLDDVLVALAEQSAVVRSADEIGPTIHGRPVATLEALASTRDARALARLPDGTVFPRLRRLALPECANNAHASRMRWPVLEALEMAGPHTIPVGSNIADDDAIPPRLFAAMPELRRVHVRAVRRMSPAMLEIPKLESLDLDQQIFNPVFYTRPEPGLLVADILALKARYPELRMAFGSDVCFELPPESGAAVAASERTAKLMSAGQLDEGVALVEEMLAGIARAPVLYSHVNRYDLRSLAVWGCSKLAEREGRALDPRALEHARVGLAELGPPSGWFLSRKGLASCRQLAKLAGNHLAWTERDRDPAGALALVELALLGATLGTDDYVFDTYARILLALERREEAYDVVAKIVRGNPKFAPVSDIVKSRGYRAHVRRA